VCGLFEIVYELCEGGIIFVDVNDNVMVCVGMSLLMVFVCIECDCG